MEFKQKSTLPVALRDYNLKSCTSSFVASFWSEFMLDEHQASLFFTAENPDFCEKFLGTRGVSERRRAFDGRPGRVCLLDHACGDVLLRDGCGVPRRLSCRNGSTGVYNSAGVWKVFSGSREYFLVPGLH